MFVIGVDLAVVRPTAIAVLKNCEAIALTWASSDGEILDTISHWGSLAVAIDAPLSLPPEGKGLRDVERELRKWGYRLLPPLMGSMRKLTERGMRLAQSIKCKVIEVHPYTSLRAMGLTRSDVAEHFGVRSVDMIDAIAAALTALAYVRGYYIQIGSFVLPTNRLCL